MTTFLYYAGWTGAIVAAVIVTVMMIAVWLALKANTPSPHEDIPNRMELRALWNIVLDRPELRQLAAQRHHRGAIYWHNIDAGFSVKDALETALTPEASAVRYDIVEV